MPRKKSTFYHIRENRVKINQERAADILGVSVEDIRRFDNEGAPPMAERLLLLWDRKYIEAEGWHGFYISRGVLCYKRHRWTPETLVRYWADWKRELSPNSVGNAVDNERQNETVRGEASDCTKSDQNSNGFYSVDW